MTTFTVDIANERYQPQREFIVENFSGELSDLSDRAKELLRVKDATELSPGDWIVIVDGEVVEAGEFAPHTVYYYHG